MGALGARAGALIYGTPSRASAQALEVDSNAVLRLYNACATFSDAFLQRLLVLDSLTGVISEFLAVFFFFAF